MGLFTQKNINRQIGGEFLPTGVAIAQIQLGEKIDSVTSGDFYPLWIKIPKGRASTTGMG